MYELKKINHDSISAALEKAEHYRLLNEPASAESICLDVLAVDPENQRALVILLLAMTDRFSKGYSVSDTKIKEVVSRIRDDYERAYYSGLIYERRGRAILNKGDVGTEYNVFDLLTEAMSCYENAASLRPQAAEPVLRWNTCARIIMQNNLKARPEVLADFLE